MTEGIIVPEKEQLRTVLIYRGRKVHLAKIGEILTLCGKKVYLTALNHIFVTSSAHHASDCWACECAAKKGGLL